MNNDLPEQPQTVADPTSQALQEQQDFDELEAVGGQQHADE